MTFLPSPFVFLAFMYTSFLIVFYQKSKPFSATETLPTVSRSIKVEIKSISSILHYANKQLIGSSCEQKVYWKLPNVLLLPLTPLLLLFWRLWKHFFATFLMGALLSKEPDQHFFSKHLTTWQKHNFSTLLKTIW